MYLLFCLIIYFYYGLALHNLSCFEYDGGVVNKVLSARLVVSLSREVLHVLCDHESLKGGG